MARFQQLQELITKVRLDLGEDPEVSRGRFTDTMLKREINRVQNVLWTAYDWPFKFREWAIPLTKDESFYELPDAVDIEGIQDMLVCNGGTCQPLIFGFGNAVFNNGSCYSTNTTGLVSLWRLHEPDEGRTRSMVEVWPTPIEDGEVYTKDNNDYLLLPPRAERNMEEDKIGKDGNNYLLLRAGRRCPEMLRLEDTCYLDDEILVAFVVSAIAERRQLPDWQSRSQYAGDLLKRMRAAGTQQKSVSLSRGRGRKSIGHIYSK